MGFLTDILNKVKRNTLDKTNLDERAYSLVANAAQSGKNFFTQTIPKIQKQATQNFDWAGQQAQQNIVKPVQNELNRTDKQFEYMRGQEKQHNLTPTTLTTAINPVGNIASMYRTDNSDSIDKFLKPVDNYLAEKPYNKEIGQYSIRCNCSKVHSRRS